MARCIVAYTDYKSPYAFLAKDLTHALERQGAEIDWRPYILDIPSFLGSATVDDQGKVIEATRNAHQWRRARYMYMDCRRLARSRDLTIRPPRKIWDSSLAAAGMLFAQRVGDEVFRRYHDAVFERFWQRELDLESLDAIAGVLAASGADAEPFRASADDLRGKVVAMSRSAEEEGVFGVPSFIIDGELFWGGEHLPTLREMLTS